MEQPASDAANAAWMRSMDERSMDATAPSTDAAAAGAGVLEWDPLNATTVPEG
jgi:hypothetical protein